VWGKSTAAAFLGLPLAVIVVGICALLSHDPARTTLPWLLMFFPAWIGAMSVAFLFHTGVRAWLWMGGASLSGYALLHWLKAAGLIGVAQ
jgi:hypothetical protein